MKNIKGDLIALALQGHFDAIVHGCNCQVTMGAGIALQIANTFPAARYADEWYSRQMDRHNKLGTLIETTINQYTDENSQTTMTQQFDVVNAYTQFQPGRNLDYDALQMCLHKINHKYKGKRVGLPQIGCGIAGGDWNIVMQMIDKTLVDCDVTIVYFGK